MPTVRPAGRPNTGLYYGLAGLILTLCIVFFLAASGIFSASAKVAPPVLVQKGEAPPPVLTKTAEAVEMPAEVRAWLEHLERIENDKQNLTIRQLADLKVFERMLSTLGPAIGELDPYNQTDEPGQDPQQVAKGKFEDLRPAWRDLLEKFRSVPPPDECQGIADDYYEALNEIPGMIGDVAEVLNLVSVNPQEALTKVSQMKNRSYENIDKRFHKADLRVQQVCDKYQTRKWFNVKADVVGGGMLFKGGL